MTKIAVVTGSVREGRINKEVSEWVLNFAKGLNLDAEFELVDIKDYDLPVLADSVPPAALGKKYNNDVVQAWSDKIDDFDGYIIVTPEYNKLMPSALKNHLDHVGPEFANKAVALVGYGSTLGVSAVQALRFLFGQFNSAVVGPFGAFNMFTDFGEGMSSFSPAEVHNANMETVVRTTVDWATALKTIR